MSAPYDTEKPMGMDAIVKSPNDHAVVIAGNLSDGFSVIGPFASFDEAADWCERCDAITWIATLEDPL